MIYSKNCPQCNKKIIHKTKAIHLESIKNNRCCKNCGYKITGEKQRKIYKYERICPNCKNTMIYKNYNSWFSSKQRNTWCRTCAKEKISISVKIKMATPEIKIKISGVNNHMFGKRRIQSDETKRKIGEKNKINMLGNIPWNKGLKMSSEIRKKQRLSAIKRIERNNNNGFPIFPNYNPNACTLIEQYGKRNDYNFQHAENGGEFYLKELGYWADGYDREKNVWIEVDEKGHKYKKEKDDLRQKEIEQFLKCEFIRIKYD